MSQKGRVKIGHKHKAVGCNLLYKTYLQVINFNTYLIEHITKILAKKEFWKTIKHVDPVIHILKPFTLTDSNAPSNPQNDTIISLDFAKPLHQCLLVQTKALILIKLVIHLSEQHHTEFL